jgi:hypothetical protein
MKAIRFALGSFLFMASVASASLAQAQRTFVSGLGNDSDPCTRTAPCRTFARAVAVTSAGGEVIALDSAGYGPVAITQALSITAPPGVYAGISVSSGDGVDINVAQTDTVNLRGLTVISQGTIGIGIAFSSSIQFNTGGILHIENCVVTGFLGGAGVVFEGPGYLEMKDSIIRGNATGIVIRAPSDRAFAAIDHVRVENGDIGLFALENSQVTVRDSIASGNTIGFEAKSNNPVPAELNIENCVASNNRNYGIRAESNSTGVVTIRVSNSTVTDNNIGMGYISRGPVVFLSRGNNTVEGNASNIFGMVGSFTPK